MSLIIRSQDLVNAAERGDEQTVRALLYAGVAPDTRNTISSGHQETPLMLAAKHGHLAIVEVLLEHGADVSAMSTDGWSPLSCALHGPTSLPIMARLFEAGADPNECYKHITLLMDAASVCGVEELQLLLDAGANIFVKEPLREGRTALDFARTLEMRDFLESEKNRRITAVLSLMPSRMPKEIRKHIFELMRKE